MKQGDLVRVIRVPDRVQDSEQFKTCSTLKRCIGRVFPVQSLNGYGMMELHVGEIVGRPAYIKSIWVDPECVELVRG